MSTTGLHHVALNAADFDATIRFYVEGLGLDIHYQWVMSRGSRAAMLGGVNGTNIEVFEAPGRPQPVDGAINHFALKTDNVDREYTAAVEAGATPQAEPMDFALSGSPPAKARIAFCRGLDGEMIEFFQSEDI